MIFVSYAREDKKFLREFREHLKYLERTYGLLVWDDTSIRPGMRWREEIATALAQTRVAVLLVSASFLASDFIADVELPSLLQAADEGRVTLISVVCSACLFAETPLAAFQAFAHERPLARRPKSSRDEVWEAVARAVTEEVERE